MSERFLFVSRAFCGETLEPEVLLFYPAIQVQIHIKRK